jgi:hypothetical protein
MKTWKLSAVAVLLLTLCSGCIIDADDRDRDRTELNTVEMIFSMDDAALNGSVASVVFDVPFITPRVVDQGAVLMYYREQGTWTAMPYTFAVESPDLPAVDYTISIGYGFDVGTLEVYYEASTEAAPILDQPDRRMKAVVVDDLRFAREIDPNDYEAVKLHFGLKD